jgi:hypothetical protein
MDQSDLLGCAYVLCCVVRPAVTCRSMDGCSELYATSRSGSSSFNNLPSCRSLPTWSVAPPLSYTTGTTHTHILSNAAWCGGSRSAGALVPQTTSQAAAAEVHRLFHARTATAPHQPPAITGLSLYEQMRAKHRLLRQTMVRPHRGRRI